MLEEENRLNNLYKIADYMFRKGHLNNGEFIEIIMCETADEVKELIVKFADKNARTLD